MGAATGACSLVAVQEEENRDPIQRVEKKLSISTCILGKVLLPFQKYECRVFETNFVVGTFGYPMQRCIECSSA